MTSNTEIESAKKLLWEVDDILKGVAIPGDVRSKIACGCFDQCLEHCAAMLLLFEAELNGSLYSLMRIAYEAHVKGAWILRCATENDISAYNQDKPARLHVKRMVAEIEKSLGVENGTLSRFHKANWKILNGFTHTSLVQIGRRYSQKQLGSVQSDQEMSDALKIIERLLVFAAVEFANATGQASAKGIQEIALGFFPSEL